MPSATNERLFILDTNSYFRLAESFHPIIATIFGEPPCKFRVVRALDHELSRSPRLLGKFHWASSPSYAQDRMNYLHISATRKKDINTNREYMIETARELGLSTSPVDLYSLAVALSFKAVIVTDDNALALMAAEYEVPVLGSLDILKLMLDEKHASIEEIKEAVELIDRRNDIPDPKEFWKKYHEYFDRPIS